MYRQKGTGRARHGGTRVPQFRGGGVAHGPQPRSYAFKLNKKVRRNALKSALSSRHGAGHLIVFAHLDLPEIKTAPVAALLKKLNVESALIVTAERDERVERSARNIPRVKILAAQGLNVEDVLRHEHLVLTASTVEKLKERLGA
jgi:large subunit ribosomal protein L4